MSRYIDADALKERLIQNITLTNAIDRSFSEAPSIDLADYVPKDFHDKTCEAMAKRHIEEIQKLMPKRGEWIEKIVDDVKITVCSNCDKEPTFTHYYGSCGNYSLSDFCPNCGADMREREGE